MNLLRLKLQTALALSWRSVARVLWYRLSLRLGINPVRRLSAAVPAGRFYRMPSVKVSGLIPRQAGYRWLEFFGQPIDHDLDRPPEWFKNYRTGASLNRPGRPWWAIRDFDAEVGDIKGVWELSRLGWVLAAAQHAAIGDAKALDRLNEWLSDWSVRNPPYWGPNWKCGQEASIRVVSLLAAAVILDQTARPEPGLVHLVRCHLLRIAPTIGYAIAQNNNHGTSEAAALFMGGSWLRSLGLDEAGNWSRTGRKWLEERVDRLIGADGTFSQYSLNYHRLMLDTLSMAELWRRRLDLPTFSARFRQKAGAAARWLHSMVDAATGDGPNVGANDGANLLPLSDLSYRDYRPSVQLATVLFRDARAYRQTGPWDASLQWFKLELPPEVVDAPGSFLADEGGFMIMRRGSAMAMLRYPRFRFRPSQADLLHLDLWVNGRNLLRDAGTFSYNTTSEWMEYFSGVAGHNTVQFDGRDQMPRLSRFLFGEWLRTDKLWPLVDTGAQISGGAAYRDARGARHSRHVALTDSELTVRDDVSGFVRFAVLRWRLVPGEWRIVTHRSSGEAAVMLRGDGGLEMTIGADVPIARCEITSGYESLHYLQKTPAPVLEVEVTAPGVLTTHLSWPA